MFYPTSVIVYRKTKNVFYVNKSGYEGKKVLVGSWPGGVRYLCYQSFVLYLPKKKKKKEKEMGHISLWTCPKNWICTSCCLSLSKTCWMNHDSKQCRPRSDTTECGIGSGSTHLLRSVILIGRVNTLSFNHYENTTVQIYWKFHLQKLNFFSDKNSDIFIFLFKT